ncbi:MAG TPA: DUF4440 domain-containing protein [Bacteroidales bacterium]|nr:DUF4440 domain-containing protein [Bacteroidales bacterium]
MMKPYSCWLVLILFLGSCVPKPDPATAKQEILATEKAFEKRVADSGMAEAFAYYAAEDAVINRGRDSLIFGKAGILNYYAMNAKPGVSLSWTPDFVGLSGDFSMGYTYGRYVYSRYDSTGKKTEHQGIFHTVWKKQQEGWRYVWD